MCTLCLADLNLDFLQPQLVAKQLRQPAPAPATEPVRSAPERGATQPRRHATTLELPIPVRFAAGTPA